MKNFFIQVAVVILASFCLFGCARDLSSSTYTSDSTLNIVLEGQVLSVRNVQIKESEKLGDNTAGALIGGAGTGVAAGASGGNNAVIVGGILVGGILGAVTEQALGTNHGIEYVVKVDTSTMNQDYYEGSALMRNALAAVKANGIITVVQSKEAKNTPCISSGQNVLVIISEKRTRVIPNNIKQTDTTK
ncbi:MAG: hypothetical protein AB8B67_01095 [Rickettsiaceae bacterium]